MVVSYSSNQIRTSFDIIGIEYVSLGTDMALLGNGNVSASRGTIEMFRRYMGLACNQILGASVKWMQFNLV